MNIPSILVLILLGIGAYYAIKTLRNNGTGCKSCGNGCSDKCCNCQCKKMTGINE